MSNIMYSKEYFENIEFYNKMHNEGFSLIPLQFDDKIINYNE